MASGLDVDSSDCAVEEENNHQVRGTGLEGLPPPFMGLTFLKAARGVVRGYIPRGEMRIPKD